ncbi:MAG: hypothetical protein ABI432_14875 [Flavobacteriales bacterium]
MFAHRSLALLFLASLFTNAFATHVVAGEIRYSHLSITTYTVEVLIWSDLNSPADRPDILVDFGDGVLDTIPRTSMIDDPIGVPCYPLRRNSYSTTHTYPGFGTYIIRHTDANRNGGIINVPNSDEQAFSVSAMLIISPSMAGNNSVQFTTPAPTNEWNWSTLIHDLQATDADGDSLTFQLVTPEGLNGLPIDGYQSLENYTPVDGYVWCNPTNGALFWDHPTLLGEYAVAIRCEEWRGSELIGQATRDMIICVADLPTSVPTGYAAAEDMRVVQATDHWIFENDTPDILRGELIDARGSILRTFNLASGRTIVPSIDLMERLTLLRATTAEGHQRTFKLLLP